MFNLFNIFKKNKRGQSLVEYAIIIGMVIVTSFTATSKLYDAAKHNFYYGLLPTNNQGIDLPEGPNGENGWYNEDYIGKAVIECAATDVTNSFPTQYDNQGEEVKIYEVERDQEIYCSDVSQNSTRNSWGSKFKNVKLGNESELKLELSVWDEFGIKHSTFVILKPMNRSNPGQVEKPIAVITTQPDAENGLFLETDTITTSGASSVPLSGGIIDAYEWEIVDIGYENNKKVTKTYLIHQTSSEALISNTPQYKNITFTVVTDEQYDINERMNYNRSHVGNGFLGAAPTATRYVRLRVHSTSGGKSEWSDWTQEAIKTGATERPRAIIDVYSGNGFVRKTSLEGGKITVRKSDNLFFTYVHSVNPATKDDFMEIELENKKTVSTNKGIISFQWFISKFNNDTGLFENEQALAEKSLLSAINTNYTTHVEDEEVDVYGLQFNEIGTYCVRLKVRNEAGLWSFTGDCTSDFSQPEAPNASSVRYFVVRAENEPPQIRENSTSVPAMTNKVINVNTTTPIVITPDVYHPETRFTDYVHRFDPGDYSFGKYHWAIYNEVGDKVYEVDDASAFIGGPITLPVIQNAGTYTLKIRVMDGSEAWSEEDDPDGIFTIVVTCIETCTTDVVEVKEYNFTNGIQTETLSPGTYKFEVWGAQGGDDTWRSSTYKEGGYGGYSYGEITFDTETTVYIVVGGKGANTQSTSGNGNSYNGGGTTSGHGSGGGGATHIATASGTLSSLSSNTGAVLIVAGGGGGIDYGGSWQRAAGAGGGGNELPDVAFGTTNQATTTSGYQFGQGQKVTVQSGGGGGGYYGGYQGIANDQGDYYNGSKGGSSGGGGSAYLSPRLSDTGGEKGVRTGNGYAKITKIDRVCVCDSETVYDFDFTGNTQQVTLGPGVYQLEVWGAQGGYNTDTSYIGAKGGYSVGTLTLTTTTVVFVEVGGQGSHAKTASKKVPGGYNGGGDAYTAAWGRGSGGGGTDIRIAQNSLYARVIVAGGAGGNTGKKDGMTEAIQGGYGGGTTAGNGITVGSTAGSTIGAGGGTQTAPGVESTNAALTGSFGKGASYAESEAGGGGGWYGGAAGNSAGGGSGYVYTSATASSYPSGNLLNSSYYLTDAFTRSGIETFPSPTGEDETGHAGNGYARITRIGGGSSPQPSGARYVVYDRPTTWHGAKTYCESQGGHLATITTANEQQKVEAIVNSYGHAVWLGGYRDPDSANFRWITNEPFNYSNWDEGEPSNFNGGNIDYPELYLGIYGNDTVTGYATKTKWNDFTNTTATVKGALCEYDDGFSDAKISFYTVHNDGLSWTNAKAYCETKGGHLATINSAAEETLLEATIKAANYTKAIYWLGGNNITSSNSWSWVTGEDTSYSNWGAGEPTGNQGYLGILTDKAPTLIPESSSSLVWKWFDNPNEGIGNWSIANSGFICEY